MPIHYEGWKHFGEGRSDIERELAAAPADVRERFRWLEIPPRRWAVVRWARRGRDAASAPHASMPSKRSDTELVDAAARRERPLKVRARPISSRLRQPGDLERVV
jgi:hypothetical protein